MVVALTSLSHGAGCACKMPAALLGPLVQALPQPTDPEWTVVLTDRKARMTEKEVLGTAEELVRRLRENPRYRLTMQWTLEEGPQ